MDKEQKRRLAVAEDKFGLIAPVINGSYPDGSKTAYFQRIAQNPVRLSDGRVISVKASTLATWERTYRAHGFEGLMPRWRSDLGKSRKIDDELGAIIARKRAERPRMSATLIYDELVRDGVIALDDVSLSTVRRYANSLPSVERQGVGAKDRRAWEAERVNDVWQADTLYGPYVGEPSRRAYLQAIIDDKSRKIVAARFVERDDAITFQATLKAAVGANGIPCKLYVDNGSPYKNDQLSLICGGMGTVLLHAPVRDGAAKGKIERFNRTLRMRFLSALPEDARESLESLNDALSSWVIEYNATVHSSTGKAPVDAFEQESGCIRWAPADGLDDMFRNQVRRRVANDATIRVSKVVYDAPMGLIGEKVDVFFTPGDPDDAWVELPDGTRQRLSRTDKQANAATPRVRPAYSVNFGAKGV